MSDDENPFDENDPLGDAFEDIRKFSKEYPKELLDGTQHEVESMIYRVRKSRDRRFRTRAAALGCMLLIVLSAIILVLYTLRSIL